MKIKFISAILFAVCALTVTSSFASPLSTTVIGYTTAPDNIASVPLGSTFSFTMNYDSVIKTPVFTEIGGTGYFVSANNIITSWSGSGALYDYEKSLFPNTTGSFNVTSRPLDTIHDITWGFGNILLITDYSNTPLGYGWASYGSAVDITGFLITSKITQVTAVPEPEASSMLIVGLGLIGFMAMRRKYAQS